MFRKNMKEVGTLRRLNWTQLLNGKRKVDVGPDDRAVRRS